MADTEFRGVVFDQQELDLINKRLMSLPDWAKKEWNKMALKNVQPLVPQVKARAPVETGMLKKAIKAQITKAGNVRIFVDSKVFAANSGGGWNQIKLKGSAARTSWKWRRERLGRLRRPSKYATIVEFGGKRKKIKAQPFMLDIFMANKSMIVRKTQEEFYKAAEAVNASATATSLN